MNKEEQTLQKKIKKILAELLGVEPEDINNFDSFKEDLHMGPVDLIDFLQSLKEIGLDSERIDFSEVETLEDLYELI